MLAILPGRPWSKLAISNLRHAVGDGGNPLQDVAAARHASRRHLAVDDARHQLLVAVVHHDVDEAQAVGGEGRGVRAAEHGANAALAEDLRQRVGEGARLGVGGQKDDVEVAREKVLGHRLPVEGRVVDLVTELTAPGRHRLRHDARVVPSEAAIEVALDPAASDCVRQDLENANAQRTPPGCLPKDRRIREFPQRCDERGASGTALVTCASEERFSVASDFRSDRPRTSRPASFARQQERTPRGVPWSDAGCGSVQTASWDAVTS